MLVEIVFHVHRDASFIRIVKKTPRSSFLLLVSTFGFKKVWLLTKPGSETV